MLWAYYGIVFFEHLTSPEDFSSTRDYNYAEHKVVQTLERIQWTGDDTEVLDMEGLFHFSFCNPRQQLDYLYGQAETHTAAPLVYAYGEFRGYFVIKEIIATYQLFTADGVLASSRFKMTLKGVPLAELYDEAHPPQPGHQPWAIIGDQPISDQPVQQPLDTATANAIFGPLKPSPTANLLLPATGAGTTVLTRVPPSPPIPNPAIPFTEPVSKITRSGP